MKYSFLQAHLTVPLPCIWPYMRSSTVSSISPVGTPNYQHEMRCRMIHAKHFVHVASIIQARVEQDVYSHRAVIGFDQEKATVARQHSSIHPSWSLFSLTTISLLCYSSCRLVPISQRMPGTWARTLCEEPAMSAIVAFPTINETASLHIAPIDAAASLWQLNSRCTVLPIVIRSQPITISLARTMSASQDHADPQAHRVDCCISTPTVIVDHSHQSM